MSTGKTVRLAAAVFLALGQAACVPPGGVKEEIAVQTTRHPRAHSNRLAGANSPYLLQHATNPVDWYPWGREAFEKAAAEDKPIFLSIGYSSCHWCHVMERESFENPEIAEVLNREFVSIKVDREERPDIDAVYMDAVQMMTGSGGWPLSVFLAPDQRPFFGGTYFPPEDRYGRPGFLRVLLNIAEIWREKRGEVMESADALTEALQRAPGTTAEAGALEGAVIRHTIAELGRSFDKRWGGFGSAPKFPSAGAVSLLLREHARSGDPSSLHMARHTLDRMAAGGMYDHVGGGFHRYSVDERWLVPHFEKMLYDNALLSRVYLDAFLLTDDAGYARVARETLDYVARDLSDPAGGFHSSEDADSEGVEGKFYVWGVPEIEKILGDDAVAFMRRYGVSGKGNFEGENILHLADAVADPSMTRMLDLLLQARALRVAPAKDDKVLASWNGLMISSFARGYEVLGERRFLDAATKAGRFLRLTLVEGDELRHAYRGGRAGGPAFLDDYAAVANAFVDLYEATFDLEWLYAAEKLAATMVTLFGDEEGGFFMTSERHDTLVARRKPLVDGSVPSGNSLAAIVLVRLSSLTGRDDLRSSAESILRAAMPMME
ncbi:MAG: thioredoxin domain-containing protein, partial [Lentisphaerae bacterium]|nr:thioredoxin domain-containing protein [Lentisphaerota bacterium]